MGWMRLFALCIVLIGAIGCASNIAQQATEKVPRQHFGICLHPHGRDLNEWSYTPGGALLVGEFLQGALAHSTEIPLYYYDPYAPPENRAYLLIPHNQKPCEPKPPKLSLPPSSPPQKKPSLPPEKKETKTVVTKAGDGNSGKASDIEKKPKDPTAEEEHLARTLERRNANMESRPTPEDERQSILPREGVLSRRGILPWRDEAFPPEERQDAGRRTAEQRSGYVKASATGEVDCDEEQIACFRRCWKAKPPWPMTKGTSAHYRYCQSKCLAQYMECLGKQGLRRTFDSLAEALDWLKNHPQAVGTIIVIAGVVYVVSTGGSGALVLLPLGA